jgi:hypothetical protein
VIDRPIVDIIRSFTLLPQCFTLQSCYGHFLWDPGQSEHNLDRLPPHITGDIEYRIAYLALCVENSQRGRELLESLESIPEEDPGYIQFGSSSWFWKRNPNTYALQVEPERLRTKDRNVVEHGEALRLEKTRDRFFDRIKRTLDKHLRRSHLMVIAICLGLFVGWLPVQSAVAASGNTQGERDSGFAEFSFGFKGGLSLAQHVGTMERGADYTVSSAWRSGFGAGAFLAFHVTSRFSVQQEVLYIQKGSRQDIGVTILEIPTVLHVVYDMDYIEIPVLLRLAWMRWERSEFYGMAGTAMSLKVKDRYRLTGEVTDGEETIPIRADSDMSEVDMFDFSFVYGLGMEFPLFGQRSFLEYRFTMGWNTLAMPTYAYVPFGDEELLIDNEPVPLKNQNHAIMFGIAF